MCAARPQGEDHGWSSSFPGLDGPTVLYRTPQELLVKLAVLIPPPRKHRHRYHGVLAPNAPLRGAVTARAGLPMGDEAVSADQAPVADQDLSEAGSKTPVYAASS
jgi:Putative transposase